MDGVILVPKGFEIKHYDPEFNTMLQIDLIGKYHYGTHVADYDIEYRMSGTAPRKLIDVLRSGGYYRNDFRRALIGKFGLKIDDREFSSFLDENGIGYSRYLYTISKYEMEDPNNDILLDPEDTEVVEVAE